MNERQAKAVAAVLGGTSWNAGGREPPSHSRRTGFSGLALAR